MWALVFLIWMGVVAAGEVAPQTYHVAQQHLAANDENAGSAELPFRTINRAAERAQPGDTVLVHAGVYREHVVPARSGVKDRPIVYQASPGEAVIVRGSELFKPTWRLVPEHPGVYAGALSALKLPDDHPYKRGISIGGGDKSEAVRPKAEPADSLPRTLGQVFVDGQPMLEVESRAQVAANAGTWLVSPDGAEIWLHMPLNALTPDLHSIEVSVRNRLFAPVHRGLSNIHVKGFVFEHCANQGPFPQRGAVAVRSGKDWRFEGNTIRHAKTIGLDLGSEYWDGKKIPDTAEAEQKLMIGGGHVAIRNTATDNGLCGIAAWNTSKVRIIGNVVERNNCLGFHSPENAEWEEYAGIKVHAFTDGLIEGNLVRDNAAFGVWIDNGQTRARITRNVIVGNRNSGIFMELGDGAALIDTNVIAMNDGDGLYAHDASNIRAAHNLFWGNRGFGVRMHVVSNRAVSGKPAAASGHRIVNNMILGNHGGAISLPFPSELAKENVSDRNALTISGEWNSHRDPTFIMNTNSGRVKMDAIAERLAAALEENKVPADERPNLKLWRKSPTLSLAQWQWISGNDTHSIVPSVERKLFWPQTCELTLSFKTDALTKVGCESEAQIEADFFGQPLKPGAILPGPFQTLKPMTERNSFLLWPVQIRE